MWHTYYAPTTLDAALYILGKHGPDCRIIAGGTDLLIELRRGVRKSPVLLDITRIGGLDRVWLDEGGQIHIGPTVTHNQVVSSKVLAEHALPLAQACWQVGTPALRNRGTVVGNLVTASPANDTITALWALEAQVTLRSVRGERTLSLPDFYQGVRRTALAPDEMVTDVAFPALREGRRGTFVKLGLRRTHAIAVVNAAVVLGFEGEQVSEARVTLGSVAPIIVRAPDAEHTLVGRPLTEEHIAAAANAATRAADPIDDVRGGAEYRDQMVAALVRRALANIANGSERRVLPRSPPMLWGKTNGHYRPLDGDTLVYGDGSDQPVVCTVNGAPVTVRGVGGKTLLDMLRDDLGLTGTKEGCGEGECGACTVWMDGIAVLACLVPAPRAHGTQIVTVEGLAPSGDDRDTAPLHSVQQAFVDEGAVQCGYCTPGFVMAGANLLDEIRSPSHEQIVAGLSGNLCRCTGYYKIVRAIERAARGGGTR